MSKKSRTFQPPTSSGAKPATPADPASASDPSVATTSAAAAGATGQPTGSSAPKTPATTPVTPAGTTSTATSRSAARRREATGNRVSAPPSLFERYRLLIVGAIVVVIVAGALAVMSNLSGTTANAYECTTLLTPGPTDPIPTPRPVTSAAPITSAAPGASAAPAPTPEPQPTQKLGFTTQDLGRGHVTNTTKVTYDYCPPASGQHYNVSGQAPLPHQFYPPSTTLVPGNWIHNLEHGYVVLLYKGEIAADIQQQFQGIMAEADPNATCGYSKVIAVRYDQMEDGVNFAAVAWDRALLLDQFDKQALLTFANQWQDGPQTPEPGLC